MSQRSATAYGTGECGYPLPSSKSLKFTWPMPMTSDASLSVLSIVASWYNHGLSRSSPWKEQTPSRPMQRT